MKKLLPLLITVCAVVSNLSAASPVLQNDTETFDVWTPPAPEVIRQRRSQRTAARTNNTRPALNKQKQGVVKKVVKAQPHVQAVALSQSRRQPIVTVQPQPKKVNQPVQRIRRAVRRRR